MIEIKPFSRRHLDGVYNIECTCFAHAWSRDDLARQLELPTSHFAVAECDGEVVGYMGLQIFSGEGYVTNIAVLPQYRRRGVAAKLIEYQLQNDMNFISLEVRESNLAAVALYQKAGFEPVGTRPRFYTDPDEDAVIMTLRRNNHNAAK